VTDQLLDSVRRWFEVIEVQLIDPDTWSAFEVWLHAQTIIDLADQQKNLPDIAVGMVTEIGQRMGVPVGSAPPVMAAAFENHFGECPYGPEALVKITTYLRGQINDFRDTPAKRGPDLQGAEKKQDAPVVWPDKKLW
jgi:hypothetical protein